MHCDGEMKGVVGSERSSGEESGKDMSYACEILRELIKILYTYIIWFCQLHKIYNKYDFNQCSLI